MSNCNSVFIKSKVIFDLLQYLQYDTASFEFDCLFTTMITTFSAKTHLCLSSAISGPTDETSPIFADGSV